MAICSGRRALHFVFKIGDRNDTVKFFTEILGMKILRHEEFEEGCKASCNGPYDGKWSKTMIGYGPEINHFVAELTYNYGVKSYKLGNDFLGIIIKSRSIFANAKLHNWPIKEENNVKVLEAPGGYKFLVEDDCCPENSDPVQRVILGTSNLKKSKDFWNGVLDMHIYTENPQSVVLGYADSQCKLELKVIDSKVNHEKAFGRIAFSCPTSELSAIESKATTSGGSVLTPLLSLDTPGKATVHVVILADPDGHEICFVGDEAFIELSEVDPKSEELLYSAISADKSDEWFAKKGLSKAEA